MAFNPAIHVWAISTYSGIYETIAQSEQRNAKYRAANEKYASDGGAALARLVEEVARADQAALLQYEAIQRRNEAVNGPGGRAVSKIETLTFQAGGYTYFSDVPVYVPLGLPPGAQAPGVPGSKPSVAGTPGVAPTLRYRLSTHPRVRPSYNHPRPLSRTSR